jgi:putative SOS response-associated peptidase YedK
MCNLYSITTNQAAISALFRVVNRYVGNLAPMPGVFPDYKAPIVRTGAEGRELTTARWGIPSCANFTMRWAIFALVADVRDVAGTRSSAVTIEPKLDGALPSARQFSPSSLRGRTHATQVKRVT